ncbi:hypothetical protein ACOZ4I_20400 (plasmid) [Haloarcula salina]|uniref:hypothetical protein n=1 Tax=Haloarcula salina TaxID=1429914 RepID=UPI003C6FEA3D
MARDDDTTTEFEEVDARIDLADRYDRMVESQLTALSNVDTNAWRAARLIGILIGIMLTALSVVARTGGAGITITPYALSFFAVSIVLLLISLFFAAISILNVQVGYGPGTQLADGLNDGSVAAQDYPGFVSKSLSKNIETNKTVLKSKANKLRYTYNFLIIGLITFSAGVWLLVTDPSFLIRLLAAGFVICAGLLISDFILNKRYDHVGGDGNRS